MPIWKTQGPLGISSSVCRASNAAPKTLLVCGRLVEIHILGTVTAAYIHARPPGGAALAGRSPDIPFTPHAGIERGPIDTTDRVAMVDSAVRRHGNVVIAVLCVLLIPISTVQAALSATLKKRARPPPSISQPGSIARAMTVPRTGKETPFRNTSHNREARRRRWDHSSTVCCL